MASKYKPIRYILNQISLFQVIPPGEMNETDEEYLAQEIERLNSYKECEECKKGFANMDGKVCPECLTVL